MERMERGVSPTPSSCHSSQDLGRPRKSAASYRLFPIVDPTPPASPVVLKRASLYRASGAYRRRSSSLENGPKDTIAVSSRMPTPQPTISLRESRKVSLPDIRPLQTVEELDSAVANPSPRPFDGAARVCALDQYARSTSAPREPATSEGADRATIGNARPGDRDVASHSRIVTSSFANVTNNSVSSLPFASGFRSKRSKPNLRITVAPSTSANRAPPPPSKSPRHMREESELSQSSSATFGLRPSLDPPSTPDLKASAIAHQQSFVSVGADVKLRELTVTSPAARGRSVLKFWPKKFPKEQGSAPPTPSDFGNRELVLSQSRPGTAGILSLRSPTHSSHTPAELSESIMKDRDVISRPLTATTVNVTSPTITPRTGLRQHKSAERLRSDKRPASPSVEGQLAMSEVHEMGRTQQFASSVLGVPSSTQLPARPSTADDRQSIADAIRNHARLQLSPRPSDGDVSATASLMRPHANTALAIARANVAALRNSSSSSDIHGLSEMSRASVLEMGLFHRAPAAETPGLRGSSPSRADPVAALRELSEQCDALHLRYASLRAERQKMSSGLIDKLKEQRTDPDYLSTLLNDQLSLAAVSSSMDICFAKLKSLECRKEDAIAALIAQTADTKKSPTDNIAAMIANMAVASRKSSLAPSADSDSRYALTGRSTPDYSTHRSTQSSLPRSFSYSSDATSTSQDYRLSCASSLRNDSAFPTDFNERSAPETIPEAVESPRQIKTNRPRELLLRQAQQGSDEPFLLSPTTFAPAHPSNKLADDGEAEAQPEDRPSLDFDPSIGVLDSTPKRIRVPGSKAAKVLGLLTKDGKEDPLVTMPPELASLCRAGDTDLDFEVYPEASSVDLTLPVPPLVYSNAPHGSAEMLESPAIHDLEAQLENFPIPANPSARARSKQFTVLAPLAANPPTPLVETFSQKYKDEEIVHPPRRDSARATQQYNDHNNNNNNNNTTNTATTKTVTRSMTQGSTRTTHTIQVYLEQDDFEILDLYRRGSEAAIAAIAEPLPVS